MRIVGAGQVFNELGVLVAEANFVTFIALDPATMWVIQRATLVRLMEAHPRLSRIIMQNLARRMQHLICLVEDFRCGPSNHAWRGSCWMRRQRTCGLVAASGPLGMSWPRNSAPCRMCSTARCGRNLSDSRVRRTRPPLFQPLIPILANSLCLICTSKTCHLRFWNSSCPPVRKPTGISKAPASALPPP